MNRLAQWGLLLGFLLVVPAQAQITITSADLMARFNARLSTTDFEATSLTGLQAAADAIGGNKTFDFTTAAYDAGSTYTFALTDCSTPIVGCNDPVLRTANVIASELYGTGSASDSLAVSFAQLNPDGFFLLGGAAEADFDPTVPGREEALFHFTPPQQLLKLPLTMGTSWTSQSVLGSTLFGSGGFLLKQTYTVVGWGTLITPQGQGEALKLYDHTVFSIDMGGGNFIVVDTTHTLQFFTKGEISAFMELDERGHVIGASYSLDTDIDLDTEPGEVPTSITLDQNYPNPFNPRTSITFSLRQSAPVRLAVHDLLGREVAVLVNGIRPSGPHTVPFNATNLPSGLYLYTLETATETLTRQMVLLK